MFCCQPAFRITVFLVLLITGCAELPTDYEQPVSVALEDPGSTTVGRLFHAGTQSNSGKSGFALIVSGESAFAARDDIIAAADKTVDAQYFIWGNDQTGRLLIDRLIRAADRGVRVRLLIDDLVTEDHDHRLQRLSTHANIEVRIFNPFASRGFRAFDFLSDLPRVNRRMHNKALIVDNTIAVTGGRNIGNHYFGVDTVFNFRDLDVLVVGPVVPEISSVFDQFWNSVWVVPIEAFLKTELSKDESQRMVQELHEWADAGGDDYPYPVLRSRKEGLAALNATREDLVWAEVEFFSDHPDKASGEEYSPIVARLIQQGNELEREVLGEVAYFVPGHGRVRQYRELVDRGVRVRVLTNSLGSIDQVSAFAGYAKYRYVLLRDGVELYELKADAKSGKRYWSILAAKSRATLHTKAAVYDRKTTWIGSFNADPRSRKVNTEMGMLIHSRLLSQLVAEYIETGMRPDNSYKLAINERGRDPGERLIWTTEVDGEKVQFDREPDVPVWLVISVWLLSFLPMEDLL